MNPSEIRFAGHVVLTAEEASRLWRALPSDWTHPVLEALVRNEPAPGPDAHMLFDIHLRDAVDQEWKPPGGGDVGVPPVYELIDLAVYRVQTADPGIIEEMLGPDRPLDEAHE